MNDVEKLRTLVAGAPKPPCAALIPFSIVDADSGRGFVKVEFEPQPAFGNVFGQIQGGFAVAMIDLPISLAALLKLQQWLPTVEIKTSFLAPASPGLGGRPEWRKRWTRPFGSRRPKVSLRAK